MYVLLERPGMPPRRIKVEGDKALVGRAPHCDVVIEEDFVSKQHLLLLRGIVAVDQSTNGTFLDGERIAPAVVLGTRAANLAQSDITIRVEEESQPATAQPTAVDPGLRAEMAKLQALVQDLEQAKRDAVAAVEAEVLRVAAMRQENDSLRAKVDELEKRLSEALLPPIPSKPADDSPVSMLIFKLKLENAELKRALAQQAAAAPRAGAAAAAAPTPSTQPPPAPAAAPAKSPAAAGVVPVAKDQKKDPKALVAEIVAGSDKAGKLPARPQAPGLARLSELVKLDADDLPTRADDALDAFLLAEGYRFLRRIERVVSRVAGGLIQLLQAQTMVPGVEGNLRDYLRSALADPDRALVREGLLGYLREMGRWMVAAVYAYRQAAEKFVAQLKTELSPEALMADDPAAVAKKLSGKSEAELWRRVCAHLRDLNAERVHERLEKMARDAAEDLVQKDGMQAFG